MLLRYRLLFCNLSICLDNCNDSQWIEVWNSLKGMKQTVYIHYRPRKPFQIFLGYLSMYTVYIASVFWARFSLDSVEGICSFRANPNVHPTHYHLPSLTTTTPWKWSTIVPSSECFILKNSSGTSKFRPLRFTLTEKKGKQMDQAVEMESKRTGRVSEIVEQIWRGSATI